MIIYETGNIAKYSIICMFRNHFEAIVPFSEIIFVLLQAYLPIYIYSMAKSPQTVPAAPNRPDSKKAAARR